jgi:serine protease
MKRTFAAALVVFLFAVSTFAAGTRRYVVGVRPQRSRVAIAGRALTPDADGATPLASRNFSDFKYLDSFAADLTDDEAAALRRQPDVTFVEAAFTVHAFETVTPHAPFKPAVEMRNPAVQTTPWGIPAVHAPDAWVVTRGAGVNVAIIDTGIDYNHPDLKDEYAGGYNEITKTNDPADDNGHGTHVAGIIAAEDNALGVVGVAPNARIWSVKVLDSTGSGSTATIAAGINWVIAKKVDEIGGNWIINMSLGICSDPTNTDCATAPPQAMVTACQKASDAGILIIAASGNDSTAGAPKPVGYPASFSTVVAIGAVDSSSTIADFSNQGPELALVAPGVGVLSTYPVGQGTNSYALKNSTLYTADSVSGSKRDTVGGRFVYCGIGANASDFPASVKGNIALIQRGTATFNQKTKNAVAAGASAVIIYNCSKTTSPSTCGNDDFTLGWTLIAKVDSTGQPNSACSDPTNPISKTCKDDPADLAFPWPVTIRLNNDDGEAFRSDSNATLTAVNVPDDYATLSGTSMASPHVVGVAALVWGAAPTATAKDVRAAMINTAHDLGASGQDPVYGFGLVDAYLAVKSIAPQFFSTQPASGRPILRRGH